MKRFKRRVKCDARKNICGERIRSIRMATITTMARRMTQEDLANRMSQLGSDMNRITIGRIENGTRELSDIELLRFAVALKVEVNDLFFANDSAANALFLGEINGRCWSSADFPTVTIEKDEKKTA